MDDTDSRLAEISARLGHIQERTTKTLASADTALTRLEVASATRDLILTTLQRWTLLHENHPLAGDVERVLNSGDFQRQVAMLELIEKADA
jgi:hypothetical protein